VPLLVRHPGQKAARLVEPPVSLVDVMPTILAAVGLPAPPGADGTDLGLGDHSWQRPVLTESFRTEPAGAAVERALVWRGLKLVRRLDGAIEFYDLEADPGERHALDARSDHRAGALERVLEAWVAETTRRGLPGDPSETGNVDRLRSLGYVR
jgi:arylsulfatase A-like enzyme